MEQLQYKIQLKEENTMRTRNFKEKFSKSKLSDGVFP
jgi:hypothetical protein